MIGVRPDRLGLLVDDDLELAPGLGQLALVDVDAPEQVVGAHVRRLDVDDRAQLLLGAPEILGGDVDAGGQHQQVGVLRVFRELRADAIAAALRPGRPSLERGQSGERIELLRDPSAAPARTRGARPP